MNGDHEPLGNEWISQFLSPVNHASPLLSAERSKPRGLISQSIPIRAFLELFERTGIELGIQYEDMWNMDETGVALGVCTNTQVLGSSTKKKAYIKSPENREWVSIIETISAIGRRLQALVVFKGKSLQTTWFPAKGAPDWLYTTSENGWTSNQLDIEWLQRIFIPNTTPSSTGRDYSFSMATAHILQSTSCALQAQQYTPPDTPTSCLTYTTAAGSLSFLCSQNQRIETRSELSLHSMTQHLSRRRDL